VGGEEEIMCQVRGGGVLWERRNFKWVIGRRESDVTLGSAKPTDSAHGSVWKACLWDSYSVTYKVGRVGFNHKN
jgi:hypothetical protein